ncbi:MAG TPA: hypothetical protein VKS21_06960 [Spirochaetota bacterium]|nr:hypothetical protein [Spirochaetota bacterium]
MLSLIFPGITLLLLGISFLFNKKKSVQALQKGAKRFLSLLPVFIPVIIISSLSMSYLNKDILQNTLGHNSDKLLATLSASLAGSVAVIPGFIAFPLGALLKSNGVLYMVISAFTTSLMMVGVLTFPLEQAYLQTRIAIIRNFISFLIALIVAVATGIAFGEIRTSLI